MLKSSRSPLAILALLSLVGTLLAMPALPAGAKNGEADDEAVYSACVPSAIEPVSFGDVSETSVAREAVDCMVHYGIMPGTSPTTFDPSVGVTREQMALILIRAAGPAGIDVPRVTDQRFRDIDHLPDETQDSINQLAELGITRGTTASTYTPHRVVNRRQMAQFFQRFLRLAPVGEGGVAVENVSPDDRVLTDITALPSDPYNAIRAIYEMGVTKGTTPTTYSPSDPVTRAQMALFISRMLAHTNARPAGITIQAEETAVSDGDTVDLAISLRTGDHRPINDESIDIFWVAEGDSGFSSSGRCGSKAVKEGGDTRCVIDPGDETTDGDGNLYYESMEIPESLTVYAWTGDEGDRFDLDDGDHATLVFTASESPAGFLITDDLPKGATRAEFGTTVTFTFQVVDDDQKPVPDEGAEIRIRAEVSNDDRRDSNRTRTYETDASGKVELSYRLEDPDSDDSDPDGEVILEVLSYDYDRIFNNSAGKQTSTTRTILRWSDDSSDPTNLVIEQRSPYSSASASGSSNRVTATLVDQYGDPVRRERIHFTSNDPNGLHEDGSGDAQNAYRKTTSSRGVASVSYTRKSAVSRVETITVRVEDCTRCVETISHYWVDDSPPTGTITNGTLRHYDEDREVLIVGDGSNLYAVSFDANDQFNDDASDPVTAISYQEFKKKLEGANDASTPYTVTIVISGDGSGNVNVFTI